MKHAYDLEGLAVGTFSAGRIGLTVLRRLRPFGVQLHYHDTQRLPRADGAGTGLTYHASPQSLADTVDIRSIHAPLHPQTEGLFNDELIGTMKRARTSPTPPVPESVTATRSCRPWTAAAWRLWR